jgi:hypothetical protein
MSNTPGYCLTQAVAVLEAGHERVATMLAQSRYSEDILSRCQQVTQIAATEAAAWGDLAVASATVDASRPPAAKAPFPGGPQAGTEASPPDDVPSPP